MIDLEEIREVFRQRIFDADIFPAIQWENKALETSEKGQLWMAERYLPVDESFSDSVNGDELEGIFRYIINIPINQPSGEKDATDAAKALGNLFTTTEVIETTNYKTSIDKVRRVSQGRFDGAWYSVVVDIEFKSYE